MLLNNYSILRRLFSQPMFLCNVSQRNRARILTCTTLAGLSIFGRKQKLARGIVCAVALQSQVAILYSVTIDTAMRAGIIFANVARGETAALFAVAFLARLAQNRFAGNALKAVGIHATRLFDDAWN